MVRTTVLKGPQSRMAGPWLLLRSLLELPETFCRKGQGKESRRDSIWELGSDLMQAGKYVSSSFSLFSSLFLQRGQEEAAPEA